jgi:hypothetical protein
MKLVRTFLIVWAFLVTVAFIAPTSEISMQGIKINDSKKSLENLKPEILVQEKNMIKYRTENGNDLSITFNKDKVVYMENDWLQDTNSRQPLFSDFSFGETSLKDIREKFSTNGFSHRNMSEFVTKTHLIMFNCFEFDSKNNEILVTITKISLDEENITEENVSSKLKLDALIIADKAYLDKIWGKDKAFDPNYKKIKP